MAKSKIDFILLLLATLCCSMAHAQKQVSAELRDSTESGSDIIKIVGNHSSKGAVNNIERSGSGWQTALMWLGWTALILLVAIVMARLLRQEIKTGSLRQRKSSDFIRTLFQVFLLHFSSCLD